MHSALYQRVEPAGTPAIHTWCSVYVDDSGRVCRGVQKVICLGRKGNAVFRPDGIVVTERSRLVTRYDDDGEIGVRQAIRRLVGFHEVRSERQTPRKPIRRRCVEHEPMLAGYVVEPV